MKNTGFLTLSLLIVVLLSSCAKEPKEMIIGEWKITDIQTTLEIPEDALEYYKESIEEMKSVSLLVLDRDGTFKNTKPEGMSTGSWTLNNDATQFTMIYEEGNEEISVVNEISETKLSITLDINDAKNTIVYEKVIKEE